MAICPEQNTNPLLSTAWEYGPIAFGAFGVSTFFIVYLDEYIPMIGIRSIFKGSDWKIRICLASPGRNAFESTLSPSRVVVQLEIFNVKKLATTAGQRPVWMVAFKKNPTTPTRHRPNPYPDLFFISS